MGQGSERSGSSQDHSHLDGLRWNVKLPHFSQQFDVANDASIIHVPLVVDWAESLNLVHKRVKTTAKIQRTKRVTLLDTRFRDDDVLIS